MRLSTRSLACQKQRQQKRFVRVSRKALSRANTGRFFVLLLRHPDRGGDAKKFTQLREAFEVLSDPERRKIYDQGGEEALKEHAQGGGHSGDPFGDIFGMFGGHRPGRQQKQGMQKLKGRRVELQVELEDVYSGKMTFLDVKRQRICLNCNGKGGDNVKKCGKQEVFFKKILWNDNTLFNCYHIK